MISVYVLIEQKWEEIYQGTVTVLIWDAYLFLLLWGMIYILRDIQNDHIVSVIQTGIASWMSRK